MKDYTIHDIIKLVPLSDQRRTQLLTGFDTYDKGKQIELKNTIWTAFHKMTDKLARIKYDEFLQDAQEGKRQLTPTLMQEARMAVHQDYEDKLAGKKPEKQQMEEVRETLQTINQDHTLPGFDQNTGSAK